MIAVIADDFSGAAELASAAANRGLRAEVQITPEPTDRMDLVAVTSETRSLTAARAAEATACTTLLAMRAEPTWIYKKTDSVLRGNVAAEVEAIAKAAGKRKAVIVPANPGKGRVIRDGRYFIHDTPLHETAFAEDPEHPRLTNIVQQLLGASELLIQTPDAETAANLDSIVTQLDWETTLPGGGVEFFETCLAKHATLSNVEPIQLTGPRLLVCGSLAAWRAGRPDTCRAHEIPFATIADTFDLIPTAMLAIGDAVGEPDQLAAKLGDRVEQLLAERTVELLLLEGGATAFEVMKRLGWNRFHALPSPVGVAILDVVGCEAPRLVVKPGSYDWPASIWPECMECGVEL